MGHDEPEASGISVGNINLPDGKCVFLNGYKMLAASQYVSGTVWDNWDDWERVNKILDVLRSHGMLATDGVDPETTETAVGRTILIDGNLTLAGFLTIGGERVITKREYTINLDQSGQYVVGEIFDMLQYHGIISGGAGVGDSPSVNNITIDANISFSNLNGIRKDNIRLFAGLGDWFAVSPPIIADLDQTGDVVAKCAELLNYIKWLGLCTVLGL